MIQIGLHGGGRMTIDPLDVTAVTPEVLAYALSYVTRFSGQAGAYSVAEHSVRMYDWAKLDGQADAVLLAILIHDAPECLGEGDVQRFVKRRFACEGLREYARMVTDALWKQYRPRPWEWADVEGHVKQYDERIGAVEARAFGFPYEAETLPEWLTIPARVVPDAPWSADVARLMFLHRWEQVRCLTTPK